jgi:sugar-phosphatase
VAPAAAGFHQHCFLTAPVRRVELQCEAVLFDLDGVLVDSRAVIERIWRTWADRHHVDADHLLSIAHGRRTRETLREVAPHLAVDAEVEWLDSAEVADVGGLVEVPGARRLLASLPADSWAIVTSCHLLLAERRLRAAGVPLPDVIVTSENVTAGKPAPEGYLLGAKRLGRRPERCVVFEDAPPGIAAGQAAGARVVGVSTTHRPSQLHGVETVIPDLAAVSVRAAANGVTLEIGGRA